MEDLYNTKAKLTFQSVTHQIWMLVQEYVAIRTVLAARVSAPRDTNGAHTLHRPTQHLLDNGYIATTVMAFRKLTEPRQSPSRAVQSLPTVIQLLMAAVHDLDDTGQRYLGLRNAVPDVDKKDIAAIRALLDNTPPALTVEQMQAGYMCTPIYDYTPVPHEEYHPFLESLLCLVQHIHQKYKHAADKHYAHAAQEHTWQKPGDVYGIKDLNETEADIRTLVIVQNILQHLVLARDCAYGEPANGYGLERSYGLSADTAVAVVSAEQALLARIDTWRAEARQILGKPERAQALLEVTLARARGEG